jgi:fatty-acyl-CoA synthase
MPIMNTALDASLSIIRGIPLSEEPGLGVLTLPGFLREVTLRYTDREALVIHHDDGSTQRWTYRELWDRALAVACSLAAYGVGKDSRVGVLMTNRPEWIASFFGITIAGGMPVALSTFSTPAELEHLLRISCVSTLLFERRVLKKDFAAMLAEIEPSIAHSPPGKLSSAKLPYLQRLVALGERSSAGVETWSDFSSHGEGVSSQWVQARIDSTKPADAGALFFSSGSTGQPKGVLSTHRGVTIQCWRWRRLLRLGDDVRAWTANGFFWSGNFAGVLGATLSAGGSLVLQPTFEPIEALRLMQAERVTRAFAWPHQYEQLATAPNWSSVDLSSFRYVDRRNRLGQHPTASTTWLEPNECYGNTETFTISSAFASNTPREVTGESHGKALPGNTIKIVDPLTGETVPRGERGEIAVKGPTLMLGYIGVAAEETFDTEGFFRTGDGGYIDELDRLVWEGRINDIIKTGGANVSPVEVDGVLATYPGIKVNRTVGVPHETLGEMVVACVVPQEGATLEEAAIREFLKGRLASYKVPRRVVFVREDELALTGSAKVKLSELRKLAMTRLEAGH